MSRVIRFLLGGLAVVALPATAGAQYYPGAVFGPRYQPPIMGRYMGPGAFGMGSYGPLYLGLNTQAGRVSVSPVLPLFSSPSFSLGANFATGRPVAGVPVNVPGLPYGFYPYVALPGSTYSSSYGSSATPGFLSGATYSSSYRSSATPGYMSGSAYSASYGSMGAYGSDSYASGNSAPGSYTSGSSQGNNVFVAAQREFERAQRAAGADARRKYPAVKDVIYDQWAYERLGVFGGVPNVKVGVDQPEELAKALTGLDEEAVASGDALNHILVAVVAAEGKGGKGPSAFLGPRVLDAVRFTGSPAADAVNLVREAGKLPFPAAFGDPKLKDTRDQLDADFAAAVAPLRDGKSPDPARLTRVGLTLQKLQEAATPVLRGLPFEESTAARRFLNRFEKALPVLRGAGAVGLVSPAWAADGTSAAELVKHMHKNKLLFGPAAEGGTDSYLALHRALATYLFAISEPPKKK